MFHEKLPDELLLVPTTVPSTLRLIEVTPTLSLPLTFTVTPTLGSNAELFAGALKLAVGEVTSAVEPLFTFTWIELEPLLPAASDAVTVNVCVPLTAVPEFHDLSAFILLSAVIANSVRLETSYGPFVPNLWGMILGDSTLTRKTTAMRMLCGLSSPSSGNATVAGFDVKTQPEEIKKNIGYMSQKFSLYDDLTVIENMQFYAGVYKVPRARMEERIDTGCALVTKENLETPEIKKLLGQ